MLATVGANRERSERCWPGYEPCRRRAVHEFDTLRQSGGGGGGGGGEVCVYGYVYNQRGPSVRAGLVRVGGGLVRIGDGLVRVGGALMRVGDADDDEPLSLRNKIVVFTDVVVVARDIVVGVSDFVEYARGALARLRGEASGGGADLGFDGDALDRCRTVRASLGMESDVLGKGMTSYHRLHKLIREKRTEDVQFEDLPEDMLCMIFSILQLKEAARTSVLSSKWRHMWKICPKLRFDGSAMCGQYVWGRQLYTQKFTDNVNAVLKQQNGKVAEALEVKIEFDSILVDYLNNWVSFAASSWTKNLALDLVPMEFHGRNDRYIFPLEVLEDLKRFDLHLVDVTRKDVEDMLSSCSNPEWLSAVRCYLNDELKVDRPLSRLLYLHVAQCEITKREINAMKLKTFVYKGVQLPVDPSQAQELEVADIIFNDDITFEYALTVLPKVLPSVQNLTLHAHLLLKSPWWMENSSKFSQLKHLKMLLFHSSEDMDNILSLASFLRAAPLIEELEIHFNISGLWPHRCTYIASKEPTEVFIQAATGYMHYRIERDQRPSRISCPRCGKCPCSRGLDH